MCDPPRGPPRPALRSPLAAVWFAARVLRETAFCLHRMAGCEEASTANGCLGQGVATAGGIAHAAMLPRRIMLFSSKFNPTGF